MDEFYSHESSTAQPGAHITVLDRELKTNAPSREVITRVIEEARPTGGQRVAWLLSMFSFLLLLSFFLPFTVEKMSYAVARGRDRAKYEVAGEQLNHVGLNDLSKAYQLVANRVSPSVVHINVISNTPETANLMDLTFSGPRPPRSDQGSGVIVDESGYILTNYHVVADAAEIRVRLSDGRRTTAKVIGVDQLTDLAVLKISDGDLIAVDWGDSEALDVGALVWAMGSPFGLESSVTFGILSGKNRSEKAGKVYQNFLQTDAAVNPGNSGGPLVDTHGRLVGINTAIVGDSYQGIGFAIPSSVARPVYERIKSTGHFPRGWLGVRPVLVTEDRMRDQALPDTSGAAVLTVQPKSPAEIAGIKPNDVIIEWDGHAIEKWTDLYTMVAATPAGKKVAVKIIRGGAVEELTVLVNERPEED